MDLNTFNLSYGMMANLLVYNGLFASVKVWVNKEENYLRKEGKIALILQILTFYIYLMQQNLETL